MTVTAFTTMPRHIKVGPADYKVRTDPNTKLYGSCNERTTSIVVSSTQSTVSARDTLMHEALHAVIFTSSARHILGFDDDEPLVRVLTPWLLGLIRDNPDLVTFLTADA